MLHPTSYGRPFRDIRLQEAFHRFCVVNSLTFLSFQVRGLEKTVWNAVVLMVVAQVVTTGTQILTGANTFGLLSKRSKEDYRARLVKVLEALSLDDKGREQLASVIARSLVPNVVTLQLKEIAGKLMDDPGLSASKDISPLNGLLQACLTTVIQTM
jgi:hypothetical protein